MYHDRLITGVAATLGAIAVVLAVVGVAGSPVALPVALAFAASAVLMYDQLSGRMAARVYRRVERQARVEGSGTGEGTGRRRRNRQGNRRRGSVGAGPREEWTPPRDGDTIGEAAAGGHRRTAGARESRRREANADRRGANADRGPRAGRRSRNGDGPTAAAAYRTLDLEPGADDETVKRAYREKVKEVHPDTGDGDETEFMAVKRAYERLSD